MVDLRFDGISHPERKTRNKICQTQLTINKTWQDLEIQADPSIYVCKSIAEKVSYIIKERSLCKDSSNFMQLLLLNILIVKLVKNFLINQNNYAQRFCDSQCKFISSSSGIAFP